MQINPCSPEAWYLALIFLESQYFLTVPSCLMTHPCAPTAQPAFCWRALIRSATSCFVPHWRLGPEAVSHRACILTSSWTLDRHGIEIDLHSELPTPARFWDEGELPGSASTAANRYPLSWEQSAQWSLEAPWHNTTPSWLEQS